MTDTAEYAMPQDLDRPKPAPLEAEEVCECGYPMGKRFVTYRQDGGWWVLLLYGLPNGAYIWNIDMTCPACGKPWCFHARRKGRQAAFE
jgi:hypothetical protein